MDGKLPDKKDFETRGGAYSKPIETDSIQLNSVNTNNNENNNENKISQNT